MRLVGRRGLVALGFLLALAPLSAYAEDGNQAAIDAAKAEKAWLMSMPVYPQGVVLGQREIANAKAIAKLLSFDAHAQAEIPNSMGQYTAFCAGAIQHSQANLSNAAAMASAKPWDLHAQAELANATALDRSLWTMIGETYPGNPYYKEVQSPSQAPIYSDAQVFVADDQALVAEDVTDAVMASTEDWAIVAEDAVDGVAE